MAILANMRENRLAVDRIASLRRLGAGGTDRQCNNEACATHHGDTSNIAGRPARR
jgi:hypothetical protein